MGVTWRFNSRERPKVKTSLKVARGTQLLGALFLIAAIIAFSNREMFGVQAAIGLFLIIGARTYEWMTRE